MNSKKPLNEKCWYTSVCSTALEKGCDEYCTKYREMKYLLEHSWLPESKQTPTGKLVPTNKNDTKMFKQLDDIRNDIRQFVKDGESLYIASEYTGNGKTTWAIKLLHKYFERVWEGNARRVRGIFVHVPTLLIRLKNFENPLSYEEYTNLKECDLVVWDDIASTSLSSYDFTQLLAIIDYRDLAEKSNIYTSNLVTEEELLKAVGERLTSRIYRKSTKIIFTGKDER